MILLNDVSYRYPDGTPGLSHVSLHLQAGECCVLSGPNGSGKSTLFRILNGLAFPQSGSYLLDNQPITESYLKNKKKDSKRRKGKKNMLNHSSFTLQRQFTEIIEI